MRFAALRRLGLRKNAVELAPFVRFFSATFFVRWNYFAIPLSRTKNVAYSQNVMRQVGWRAKDIGHMFV
jgi:hypothetical protein